MARACERSRVRVPTELDKGEGSRDGGRVVGYVTETDGKEPMVGMKKGKMWRGVRGRLKRYMILVRRVLN